MKLSITGSLAYLLSGGTCMLACHTTAPPEDPASYNAAVNCTVACDNMHKLGCESGKEIVRCVTFCERVQHAGYLTLPVRCIVDATTRSEVRLCGASCSDG